jgi:signal transduction histidine kinase
LTIFACGLWGAVRRPGELRWLLLAFAGSAWFAGNFADAGSTVISSIGAALLYLHRGPLVHATVSGSWPRHRPTVALAVVAGYAAALTSGTPNSVLTLIAAGFVGTLAASTLASRRSHAPRHLLFLIGSQLTLSAALALAAVTALANVGSATAEGSLYGYEAGLSLSALLLAAALTSQSRSRTMLADLVVVELGPARRPDTMRGALARALGDSSLKVGYWMADARRYVDADGLTVTLPDAADPRAATLIERDGEPMAALVHDPAVLKDPALLEAVREATALILANSRLEAEVATQLGELRASRGRIVQARDEQRRRLARLLQSGAERRLREVGGAVARARAQASPDLRDLDLLDLLTSELEAARDELGTLARGIHPRALTESGLGKALAALVERAPLPVELSTPAERLPASVEAAAYFVCAEAVTNIAKYAQASRVRCEVSRSARRVRVAVADDGVGGADPGRGSGLRGLADRIDALGGNRHKPAGQGNSHQRRASTRGDVVAMIGPTQLRTVASTSAVVLTLALAGCGSSQQGSVSKTLTLHATRASYTLITSNGPGLAPGNSFVSSSDITGGGHQDAYCVLSERRGTELCTVTLLLPRGQLTGQGVFVNGPTSSGTIALLSGTGAYSGAIGTLTTSGLTAHREMLTVRLG